MFLLIIWNFRAMHPVTDPSHSSQVHPTTLVPRPPQKNPPSAICVVHLVTGAWSVKVQGPAHPHPPPAAINCGELHFSVFIRSFKDSPQSFMSGLFLFYWKVEWGEVGKDTVCVSNFQLRVCSHPYPLQQMPPRP